MKKKIAIIGASYLQKPLVLKAEEMGITTICFAWEDGAVCKDICDKFYPISILEKRKILEICKEERIDGVVSIASDVAMPTVNYIADRLGLVGNSLDSTLISTDKFEMRKALIEASIACPRFIFYDKADFVFENQIDFPVIVKPTDRSGSRGVTKVECPEDVNDAISYALDNSIGQRVIVEEFMQGREFSVEMISYQGKHYSLSVTDKVTTGAPFFVETEHHQPADIDNGIRNKIYETVLKALDALVIKNGASHSEVLLTKNGDVRVIEIAGRMGGDFIGSDLVYLSTGYDFVKGVVNISLGDFEIPKIIHSLFSGVFFNTPTSFRVRDLITNGHPAIIKAELLTSDVKQIAKSADRSGYFIYQSNSKFEL